ncbi:MAG: methionyl-tRNA formyltransferase, partial [Ignavibacteria bacterium]|nr:methionyl-tRNA formyltransferase [Ignavibacteria bacterium]
TFFLEDKVDTGNIILRESLNIEDEDNLGNVYEKLMNLGAGVVQKTIDLIESGNVELLKQDESLASPAPKITKEICKIDWNHPAEKINNLIRGLSPHPCAFFEYNGKSYKVYKANLENSQNNLAGEIGKSSQTKSEIFVQTSDGIIQLLEIQPEGRKRMSAEEFLRGNKF